jgi:hypothetical protein
MGPRRLALRWKAVSCKADKGWLKVWNGYKHLTVHHNTNNYQYLNVCASFNSNPTPDYVLSLMLLKLIEPGSPDGPKHLAIS